MIAIFHFHSNFFCFYKEKHFDSIFSDFSSRRAITIVESGSRLGSNQFVNSGENLNDGVSKWAVSILHFVSKNIISFYSWQYNNGMCIFIYINEEDCFLDKLYKHNKIKLKLARVF